MQIKHRKAALLFAGAGLAALLAMPGAATAQPGGTGTTSNTGTSTEMQSGTDMNTSTPNGGNSSTNMSTQGQMNTNGPNATSREYGKDRACDRHQMHSGASTTDSTGMNTNCPTGKTMDTTPETGSTPDSGAMTPPSQ